ncbi:hypothetical protein ALC60_14596 [Trachymyrmex zeteki]|uniref:Uncharacterized protein n=1 Tax=Mycetomoellerius zeteki TaxID=64791 RepID=A0A151WF93_9HYME|nr:hypothetical protein ALC60_14596 [Trachymyrmex zeteki]
MLEKVFTSFCPCSRDGAGVNPVLG